MTFKVITNVNIIGPDSLNGKLKAKQLSKQVMRNERYKLTVEGCCNISFVLLHSLPSERASWVIIISEFDLALNYEEPAI